MCRSLLSIDVQSHVVNVVASMSPEATPDMSEAVEVNLDNMEESAVLFVHSAHAAPPSASVTGHAVQGGYASLMTGANSTALLLQNAAMAAGGAVWGQSMSRPQAQRMMMGDSVKKVTDWLTASGASHAPQLCAPSPAPPHKHTRPIAVVTALWATAVCCCCRSCTGTRCHGQRGHTL